MHAAYASIAPAHAYKCNTPLPVKSTDYKTVLHGRLDLIYSSRWWRQGTPTFVVTDQVPYEEQVRPSLMMQTNALQVHVWHCSICRSVLFIVWGT